MLLSNCPLITPFIRIISRAIAFCGLTSAANWLTSWQWLRANENRHVIGSDRSVSLL